MNIHYLTVSVVDREFRSSLARWFQCRGPSWVVVKMDKWIKNKKNTTDSVLSQNESQETHSSLVSAFQNLCGSPNLGIHLRITIILKTLWNSGVLGPKWPSQDVGYERCGQKSTLRFMPYWRSGRWTNPMSKEASAPFLLLLPAGRLA